MSKTTVGTLSQSEEELVLQRRREEQQQAERRNALQARLDLDQRIKYQQGVEKKRFLAATRAHREIMNLIALRLLEEACTTDTIAPTDLLKSFDGRFTSVPLSERMLTILKDFPKLSALLESDKERREANQKRREDQKAKKEQEAEASRASNHDDSAQREADRQEGERRRNVGSNSHLDSPSH